MRFKAIVVCLLGVLAISAFTAGSAWALESEWWVKNKALSGLSPSEEEISLTDLPVSLAVPSLEATIECKKSKSSGKIIKGGTNEITLSLSECKVTTMKTCKVSEPVTLKAKTEMIAANGTLYDKAVPLEKEKPFGNITITGCALPEKNALEGAVAAKPPLDPGTSQVLKFSEAITKTVNTELKEAKAAELELKFGTSTAYLTTELSAKLSGKNAGAEWQNPVFTLLCEQLPAAGTSTCPALQYWPKATVIEAKNQATIELNFNLGVIETTCATSNFTGKTTMDGGPGLGGEATSLTFSGCTNKCTITTTGKPAFAFVTFIPRFGAGFLDIFEPFDFEFKCGLVECTYMLTELRFGSVLGGEQPTFFSGGNLPLLRLFGEEAGCALQGTLKGVGKSDAGEFRYEVEAPLPLYLTN